ncbi:hypothetical protein ACIBCA_36215 [Kitasatospora sp. NPDC051170]|uniref:hypothetical protein n=1 Tax=Kitasatospora sp. NPDC051170 TaxID=3364056 RepID=UPI0037B5CD0D
MSEPRETAEAYEPEVPETPVQEPVAAKAARPRRVRRWVRGRSARWVAVGAAVVVLGGGAAAVAVHHHGGEHRGEGHRSAAGEQGHGHGGGRHGHHGQGGQDGRGSQDGRGRLGDGLDQRQGRVGDRSAEEAPAPLPSTDAAEALAKAAAAVAGGKVESLSPVTEQGGGRAWRAVVLGPDGVRHAVTVDGTSDTVTGNTVLDR